MSKIKLVKSTKRIKTVTPIPRLKLDVERTFKRALSKAVDQKWNRIVIIGQGKENGSWQYSPMDDQTVLGILEVAKHRILQSED